MIVAMEISVARVLDEFSPDIVLSFPIDRYVSDILQRLSHKRGIPYVELTASLISGMCMLMRRGELLQFADKTDQRLLDQYVELIAKPSFTPSYVQSAANYNYIRWLKIYLYFQIRGWGFKLISWLKRDPLSLHYLDAQSFLGHKPKIRDIQILKLVDFNWRHKLENFPKSHRVFFGLQLFPEASIDYWVSNLNLIDYENLMLHAAKVFSDAGYIILVKDHPSQFGFRQCQFIERLLAIPNVLFVPYEISGNEVVSLVDINFTLTGTLGLQSALLGLKSIIAPNYYQTNDDFLIFNNAEEISAIPVVLQTWQPRSELAECRYRIIDHLMRGSFVGDFFLSEDLARTPQLKMF
jgi:hypothetical protein